MVNQISPNKSNASVAIAKIFSWILFTFFKSFLLYYLRILDSPISGEVSKEVVVA